MTQQGAANATGYEYWNTDAGRQWAEQQELVESPW